MSLNTTKGTAIVTGAGQGIGRGIAFRLAQDGFNVVINDIERNKAALVATQSDISSHLQDKAPNQVATFLGDVSVEDDVKRLVESAVERFGSLDVMVANAGIVFHSALTETKVDDWDRLFAVNVRGTMLCYKHAGVQMIKQGKGGRIIGACSIAGKKGMPNNSAYAASKFAVRGLTQSAALEYGKHGITVNAYAPGAIDTTFLGRFDTFHTGQSGDEKGSWTASLKAGIPIGRLGTPGDIASLVSFLASQESQFITGQSIILDGGTIFD